MEKMSVLIDADVILEGLLNRNEFTASVCEIRELFTHLGCEQIKGYITDIGFERICCWCGKLSDKESAESVIRTVKTIVNIYPVNRDSIDKAREASFKDFESAVEIICVTDSNIFNAIVTQTPELFNGATVPILGVTDLLNRILLEKVWGENIVEPTINTALWSQGKFDTGWELAPVRRSGLRTCDYNPYIEILEKYRIDTPSYAMGAYKDLTLGNNALRLYATAWNLSPDEELEWVLLIILAPQPGTHLDESVLFKVSDENETLLEETLEKDSCNFIYAQVIGALDEKFFVDISTFDNLRMTLPAFCFNE